MVCQDNTDRLVIVCNLEIPFTAAEAGTLVCLQKAHLPVDSSLPLSLSFSVKAVLCSVHQLHAAGGLVAATAVCCCFLSTRTHTFRTFHLLSSFLSRAQQCQRFKKAFVQ